MPTFKVLPKIPSFLRPGNFSQCCVMFIVKNSPGGTQNLLNFTELGYHSMLEEGSKCLLSTLKKA
jgi:hypothetical protein